jgi:hypothetical protein
VAEEPESIPGWPKLYSSFWQDSGLVSWLENQQTIQRAFVSPSLSLLEEQQKWRKLSLGAGAISPDLTQMFRGKLAFSPQTISNMEIFQRSIDPESLIGSRKLATLSPATLGLNNDLKLAFEGASRLVQPLQLSSITRDFLGISSAIASVAASLDTSAIERKLGIARIASQAVGSWRTYLEAVPSPEVDNDLLQVQAASRSTLGITAASSILLGNDEAAEVAEEWELAPTDMREQLRERLRQIDPFLVERLDGAWNAVAQEGPDSASHVADSAVELIIQALEKACEIVGGLEQWLASQEDRARFRYPGGATGEGMVRFLMSDCKHGADFVDATVNNVRALRKELQGFKHTGEPRGIEAVARLMPSVEGVLTILIVR